MTRSRNLLAALLLPLLLPVRFGVLLLHYRIGRAKTARAAGDRGAISIELALAVVALVTIAIGVVFAINSLGGKVTKQVTDLPAAPPSQ
ncbi:hypothetical protein GCM10009760_40640 [Kitasatospora kazusensis]|uniref:Uncharacterized protein n=1 Tax=Kitasatospora kazusensis TaxID=407974 RepID=A0ABN2ZVL6_9ACTN